MLIVDANKKRSRELPAYRLYYNDNTPTTTNLERICVFLLKRLQFLLQLFLRDNHFVDHHFALSKHVIATTSSAGSDRAPLLLLALMLGRCMCLGGLRSMEGSHLTVYSMPLGSNSCVKPSVAASNSCHLVKIGVAEMTEMWRGYTGEYLCMCDMGECIYVQVEFHD